MAINFNTGPYYDDFDVEKNFYKVLYKPGYAVQARELNQMQSIQQNQTAAMANHLFKKNSMVIPGGVSLNNQADIVFFGSSTQVSDLSTLVGKTITNAPAFDFTDDATLDGYITAVVLGYRAADAVNGVPGALYVRYVKTNTADNRSKFNTSEVLQTVEGAPVEFTTDADFESGLGKVATVASGVFYTTDLFVDTVDQSIIVETDANLSTNCFIGLQVVESIVTSSDDESLLDNANGAPNQYAPGADRYKVELVLTRVDDLQNVDIDKFIVMMTIENNVITYINDKTQYSEIMKMLARRTYDANGNFVVEGLKPFVNESDNDEYVVANITNGRCYVGGYEYDQLVDEPILVRKPRANVNTQTISSVSKFATGLTEFFVAGGDILNELPLENSLVQFVNASPRKVIFAATDANDSTDVITITNHKFVTGNQVTYSNGGGTSIGNLTSGNKYFVHRLSANTIKLTNTYAHAIAGTNFVDLDTGGAGTDHTLEKVVDIVGTGVFKSIQFFSGSAGTNDIYKAYFDWVILNEGYTVEDFGGFRVVSPTPSNQGGAILHEVKIKTQTGLFASGDSVSSTTVADLRATVFDVNNVTILYLIKDSTYDIPNTEVIVKTGTSTTAVTRSFFVSNYADGEIPMIKVDNSTIKHISNMQYAVVRRREFLPTSSHRSEYWDVENVDETYENFSTSDFYAYNVTTGQFIELTPSIAFVQNSGTRFLIDLDTNATYDGDTIWIYTTINKAAASPIPKEAAEATIEIKDPSRTYMALGHAGVTSIVKVVDGGRVAVEFDGTNDKVQLNNHGLVNGQIIYFASLTNITSLSINTAYYVINRTDNDFEVSTSSGGSKVNFTESGTGTGVMLPPPNINTGVDITTRFNLSSEDYAYVSGTSLIKIRKNVASPIGRIAVKYSYLQYTDAGDFASVDSYGTWDNTDGIGGEADLGYIGTIPNTISARQDVIQTRKYIDFRTRTSNYFFKNRGTIYSASNSLTLKDINLTYLKTSLIGTYIVGPGFEDSREITNLTLNANGDTVLTLDGAAATANYTGIYFVGLLLDGSSLSIADPAAGAQTFTFPKSDSPMTYSYIKFLPKNILVYVNRIRDQLTVEHMEVKDFIEAYGFRRNENKLPLSYIEMEPYTIDMNEVRVYNFQNPVYKMLDIHDLKLRIDRVEYYSSLSLDQDIDQVIVDAQNENADQSRYGFWNENFMDMTSQEYDSPDFACTIYEKTYVSPSVVTRTINLELDPLANPATWTKTGPAITLPYIETVAIQNPFASEFVNLNPFNVLYYRGKMTLNPPIDNWIDVTTSPTVSVSTTNTVNNPVVVRDPKIIIVDPPTVVVQPPPVLPPPPIEEIVTEINNLRTSWGADSAGGKHAITFDWRTNLGRTGRVNTDWHLSTVIKNMGAKTSTTAKAGYDGTYARSLINRRYNDTGVKEYLNAGTHFDQKPPNKW